MKFLRIKGGFVTGIALMMVYGFTCGSPHQAIIISENTIGENDLVNIQELDTTFFVELKYSTADNFMKRDVYGDLETCYLRRLPAQMLVEAHDILKRDHPSLRFLVYDGLRPRSIQWKLWHTLDHIPEEERSQFVANPERGSIHNFGAAVDLTLADTLGNPLDMGTPYDFFGELAFPLLEDSLLVAGSLTQNQINNRRILRRAMTEAGFSPIPSEWWHFDALPYAETKATYSIIE